MYKQIKQLLFIAWKKIQGYNGIRTHDLYTSVLLYQLGIQNSKAKLKIYPDITLMTKVQCGIDHQG